MIPRTRPAPSANLFPPRDYSSWGGFAYLAAARYGARVSAWEVWNEPDLDGLRISSGEQCRGRSWCGATSDFARLVGTASIAIRHANPDALVILGGLALEHPTDTAFLRALLQDSEYPVAHYADVLNFHFYKTVDLVPQTVDAVRATERAAGADLPLWVTETGYGSYPDPNAQTQYLTTVLPAFLDHGVQRVFWWMLQDPRAPVTTEPDACGRVPTTPGYGLVTYEGQAKPALLALSDLAKSHPAK